MDPNELRERAMSAFAKGRFAKAAELYEAYCAQAPKDSQAWIRLGDAWARLRKKEKAVAAYYQAAQLYADSGFFPRAIAACKLVLETEPEHAGVKSMLEELYVHKRVPSAPSGFLQAARPTPSSPAVVSASMAATAESTAKAESGVPRRPSDSSDSYTPIPLPGKAATLPAVEGMPTALEPHEEEGTQELERVVPTSPMGAAQPPSSKIPVVVSTLMEESPSPSQKPLDAQATVPVKEKLAVPPVSPVSPVPTVPPVSTVPPPLAAKGHSSLSWAPMKPPGIASSESVSKAPAAMATSGLQQKSELPPAMGTKAKVAVKVPSSGSGAFHAIEDAAKAGLEAQGENPNAWLSQAKHTLSSSGLPVDIPLFSDLPQPALLALFNHCPLRRFAPGTPVIRQGDKGNSFFIICSGRVRVFRMQEEEVELATLKEGEFFGEMALLTGQPRSAFVEAVEPDTQVLEISAQALTELSRKFPQVSSALWRFYRQRLLSNVMASFPLFRPFALEDRQQLIRRFQALDVGPQTMVVTQNQMSEGLFVVLTGHLEVARDNQKIATLKEGDLFGEISLLTKAPATATVTALERSALLKLPANDFNTLISTHPQVLELLSRLMEERMHVEEEHPMESLGWDTEDFELLI